MPQDLKLLVQNLTDNQKDELLKILKKDKKERLNKEKTSSKQIEAQKRRETLQEETSFEKTRRNIFWKKWDENLNQNPEKFNESIPQELIDFRKKWEEAHKFSSERLMSAFKNVAKNTPIDVQRDINDWSRSVILKLWNKTYTFLQPNLENYTDDQYKTTFTQKDANILYSHPMNHNPYIDEIKFPTKVTAGSMAGYMVEYRKNEKLKQYVLQKRKEWLNLPPVEDMRRLLLKLWDKAWEYDYRELRDFDKETSHINLFVYLTGIEWPFFIWAGNLGDDKYNENRPVYFRCFSYEWCFSTCVDLVSANILMLWCK